MDAEFRRMGSSDRLLQADAIAESYLRNLVVFYAGVALVFFGHGVVTANFALWNIDVLARGSDARASTYMMYGYVAYGACNVVGVPCISSLSDAVGRKRLLVFTLPRPRSRPRARTSRRASGLRRRLRRDGPALVHAPLLSAIMVDSARMGASARASTEATTRPPRPRSTGGACSRRPRSARTRPRALGPDAAAAGGRAAVGRAAVGRSPSVEAPAPAAGGGGDDDALALRSSSTPRPPRPRSRRRRRAPRRGARPPQGARGLAFGSNYAFYLVARRRYLAATSRAPRSPTRSGPRARAGAARTRAPRSCTASSRPRRSRPRSATARAAELDRRAALRAARRQPRGDDGEPLPIAPRSSRRAARGPPLGLHLPRRAGARVDVPLTGARAATSPLSLPPPGRACGHVAARRVHLRGLQYLLTAGARRSAAARAATPARPRATATCGC